MVATLDQTLSIHLSGLTFLFWEKNSFSVFISPGVVVWPPLLWPCHLLASGARLSSKEAFLPMYKWEFQTRKRRRRRKRFKKNFMHIKHSNAKCAEDTSLAAGWLAGVVNLVAVLVCKYNNFEYSKSLCIYNTPSCCVESPDSSKISSPPFSKYYVVDGSELGGKSSVRWNQKQRYIFRNDKDSTFIATWPSLLRSYNPKRSGRTLGCADSRNERFW